MSIEQEFNSKIRDVISQLSQPLASDVNNNQSTADILCDFFVFIKHPTKSVVSQLESLSLNDTTELSEAATLNDLRILLLVSFIGKLMKKRIKIYCSDNVKNSQYERDLKKMFEYFDFNKTLEIKFIEDYSNEYSEFENSLTEINQVYGVESEEIKDENVIDLTAIIQKFDLKNFDTNLKYTSLNQFKKDSADLSICYQNFLKASKTNRLLHFCFSSDFYQRQKNDILLRSMHNKPSEYSINYVCLGKAAFKDSSENKAAVHIESRQRQFKHAAEQRNLISDEKSEFNINNFTKFSLNFDLLTLGHHNDIKNLTTFDETSDEEPQSDQSSFILYNCARLHSILAKFENLQATGLYKALPSIHELDFYQLLKSDFEKKICNSFLFNYQSFLTELKQSVITANTKCLQTKINTRKVLMFLSDLSSLFSKYYSKVHVLEDPKLLHLHDTMFCRVYLLKAIYNLLEFMLDLFNIDPVNRI